jgi:hypothetical protein
MRIWCEVLCENCGATSDGYFYLYGRNTMNKLIKMAKRQGWKELNGKTLCPLCAEREAKNDKRGSCGMV